jgi:hypothetical protein
MLPVMLNYIEIGISYRFAYISNKFPAYHLTSILSNSLYARSFFRQFAAIRYIHFSWKNSVSWRTIKGSFIETGCIPILILQYFYCRRELRNKLQRRMRIPRELCRTFTTMDSILDPTIWTLLTEFITTY